MTTAPDTTLLGGFNFEGRAEGTSGLGLFGRYDVALHRSQNEMATGSQRKWVVGRGSP